LISIIFSKKEHISSLENNAPPHLTYEANLLVSSIKKGVAAATPCLTLAPVNSI
jgi:hypothetical protein